MTSDAVPRPPLGFAHRGAPGHEPPHSAAGFELAVRLGATGLSALAWSLADGSVVLADSGHVRSGLRRRRLSELEPGSAPDGLLSLDGLVGIAGPLALSIDVADHAAVEPCARAAAARSRSGAGPTWLCHSNVGRLSEIRAGHRDLLLAHVSELDALPRGLERHVADLAAVGIQALALPYRNWSGGLVALLHRFERMAFARDAVHDRMLDELLAMGVDAIYTPHPDRFSDACRRAGYGT